MAQIIPCSFTSDTTSVTDKCKGSSGLLAFYIAQGSDLDLNAMSATAAYDDAVGKEVFKLPPVLLAGKTLKKLDFDPGTITLKSVADTKKKLWTDTIEFDTKGISIQKMYNYRRFMGCCGYVVFGVFTDGQVVAIGLQPNSGTPVKIELSEEPLRTSKMEFDSGTSDDENGKQKFSVASEGVSTHGMMLFESGVTATQLEALL